MALEIVRTAAGHHARVRAEGNHEPLVVQENVGERRTVVAGLIALARVFHPDADDIDFDGGEIFVHYNDDDGRLRTTVRIPLEDVDET